MRNIRFWLITIVAVAVLAGAAWYQTRPSASPSPERPAEPVAVETARVAVGTVVEDLRALGSLRPNEAVTVSSEIAGRVERIAFAEGQSVRVGEILVELDAAILQAEAAKARSELTLARANHARAEALASKGLGTLRARDEARAGLQAAQAEVALAQARLQKTVIRAPLSGVVGLRSVSAGAYVTPGQRIVELADVDPLKVDFRVPELALPALRAGQPIRVTVDALPGKSFEGEIDAIDPIVDVAGRAIRLRASIPNRGRELLPGLFARVQIVVERREAALLIPESAVFAEGNQRFVYRVLDGRAALTAVELGQRRPGQVEVRKGLARGDVVVTAGHQKLREGAAVELVKQEKEA